jgi:hypothetical protein
VLKNRASGREKVEKVSPESSWFDPQVHRQDKSQFNSI